MITREKFTLYH